MEAGKVPLESANRGNHHHHHIQQFFHQVPRIMLLFATAVLACLVLYHSAYPFQLFPSAFNQSLVKGNISSYVSNIDLNLKTVLEKASMANRTVILTTLNEAWAAPNSVFDLFLESFRIGNQTLKLLDHVVVIGLDEKAYARCLKIHPHCYALTSDGTDFSGEAGFMTPDYLKMMWRRIDFLGTILDLGYNFIFTDTDIMWFRDPFPQFYPDADFQIACDFFRGKPSDINNLPNGGFTYVKSNTKTSHFYNFWYNSRLTYPGLHDQDVLNKIKHDPYITNIGLNIKFLDTAYFGGFCEPSKDINKVCTMHANCCVGLEKKVSDLQILLSDWQKYLSSRSNNTMTTKSSPWNAPKRCR